MPTTTLLDVEFAGGKTVDYANGNARMPSLVFSPSVLACLPGYQSTDSLILVTAFQTLFDACEIGGGRQALQWCILRGVLVFPLTALNCSVTIGGAALHSPRICAFSVETQYYRSVIMAPRGHSRCMYA